MSPRVPFGFSICDPVYTLILCEIDWQLLTEITSAGEVVFAAFQGLLEHSHQEYPGAKLPLSICLSKKLLGSQPGIRVAGLGL